MAQQETTPIFVARRWRARFAESDLFHAFIRSPVTVLATSVVLAFAVAAGLAPWIAPYNPFDMASLSLSDAFTPPAWKDGGTTKYLLGTDGQGRDILSSIIYGSRISLAVGVMAVALAMALGVGLGMLSGYNGGWMDALIMRIADVQLAVPAILVALLVDGVGRILIAPHRLDTAAIYVVVLAIGVSEWPRFARLARSAVMVEKSKEYVDAARLIGVPRSSIIIRHILPNIMGPVLVIATIGLGLAIIAEATLSYLGIGIPPTTPSLGTLIRVGNDFLFSGEWWIVLFPALALVVLVLAVNLLGDRLHDALNPRLR